MSAQERLPEYALGTLGPAETAQVEALLAKSEEARAELRQHQETLVALTEGLPPVQPPADVWHKIQAELEPVATTTPTVLPAPRGAPRSTWLGWALAACLSVVAVGELIWVGTSQAAHREARREAVLVTDFLTSPEVQKFTLRGRQRQGIGSVLTRPGGEALFVLGEPPPEGQSYQAWGHGSDDWEPGSGEQLTSLEVSGDSVFVVDTGTFGALYLSLEPEGGSPQPTYPLSRVALGEPVAGSPLEISAPADGSVIEGERVIVSGVVDTNVTNLSYVLNGETRQTTAVGTRFTFTATLRRGENTLVVRATGPEGTVTEALTLIRP